MPITLPEVRSGYNLGLINDNFQQIQNAWDEKLDRAVSTQPNQMEQALDMNSNAILNIAVSDDPNSMTTKEYVDAGDLANKEYTDELFSSIDGVEGIVPQVQARQKGDGVTTSFASPSSSTAPNSSMLVNIDGVTQRPVTDFTVGASGNIVFVEAPALNTDIDVTFFQPVNLQEVADASQVTATGSTVARTLSDRFADVVNVKDFGATGDGVTDDTVAIQAAADYCKANGKKLIAAEGVYVVSGQTLDFRRIPMDFDAVMHFKDDTTGYLSLGGNSNSGSNPKQYVREVFANDPRDIQTPLIRIVGAKDQLIEIERCEAVMLYAKNNLDIEAGSIAYSTFRFQYVKRVWIFGEPQDGGSTFPGWINENTFYLKRTSEILMGNGNASSYSHNHNIFHTGTFESSGRKIEIIRGSQNRFYNLRLESVDPNSIIFRSNAEDNKVYVSWSSSQATQPAYKIPYLDEGRNNMVTAEDEGQYSVSPALILNTDTLVLDSDSNPRWSNIKDVGNWVSPDEDSDRKTGVLDVSKVGNRLSVPSNRVIARTGRIPVSATGDSWVSIANGEWSAGGYRALIYGYTRAGNPLTPSAGDMYVVGQGDKPFGNVNTTDRTTGDYIQITNNACYYIEVVLVNGSANALIEYINVSVRNPKSPAAIASTPIVQQADWGVVCNVASGILPTSYSISEDVDRSVAWSKTMFIPDQSVMTATFGYSTNVSTGHAYRQSIVNIGNSGAEVYITDIANQDLDGVPLGISYVEVTGGFNITFTKPTSVTPNLGSVSLIVNNPKGVYEV